MVLEGDEAVKAARQVIGATNPLEAAPGSIRGDFALEVGQNMVHGRTPTSPPSARSPCSSPSAAESSPIAARRSGARSSSSSASPFPVAAGRTSRSCAAGEPRRRRPSSRTRARKAQAVARRPATLVLGVDTVVALDDAVFGKPRDAAAGARRRCARLAGRDARGRGRRHAGRATARRRRRRSGHRGRLPRARRRRDRRPTSATRGVAGTRRRLRHPGPRRGARGADRRATTSTSSGCRSPLLALLPSAGRC